MNELPEKAMKLLALALNHAAPEGEWHNAAVKAVLEMRKAGVPAEYFSKIQTHPQRAESPHIMPFGRFKGKPLSCLPDWYLGWIMDNLDLREPLLSRVQAELNNRDS